jgi:DNA-binding NarL/FixJ family response regulator
LHRDHPALSIAVLTDDGDPSTVGPLLNAGALGVIPRQLEPRLVLRALELVLLGGSYVPICALGPDIPAMASERGAFGRLGQPANAAQAGARVWPGVSEGAAARFSGSAAVSTYSPVAARRCARAGLLSPRQQQIMRLVHLGNTNKTIARTLNISEGTVKIHLAAVFRLLGAANRAAAVALYNGWQYGKLQVLRAEHQVSDPPPRRGMRSPVPLRSPPGPHLPVTERSGPFLIAAQPAWPFAPRRRRPAPAVKAADAVGVAEVEAVAETMEAAEAVTVAEIARSAQAMEVAKAGRVAEVEEAGQAVEVAEAVEAGQTVEVAEALRVAEVAKIAETVQASKVVEAAEVAGVGGTRRRREPKPDRRVRPPGCMPGS